MRKLLDRDAEEIVSDFDSEQSASLPELLPVLYEELRRLARKFMAGERRGHSLEPTALVHEAYLRLAVQRNVSRLSRGQFLALAARMMRRILVDHSRRRRAQRRGGEALTVTLEDVASPAGTQQIDLLAVDEVLESLGRLDKRQAHMVELRFFGGLSVEETAAVTGTSPATVKREWQTAKIYLRHALRSVSAG